MKKLTLIFIAIIGILSITNAQNNCLDFDGSDDYVDFGVNSPPFASGENTMTIEAWIKTTSTSENIVSWGVNGGDWSNVQFRTSSGGKLEFGSHPSSGGSWQSVASSNSVNTGNWVHVAVVKSITSVTLYINGVLDGSSTNTNSMTVDRMAIGKYYEGGDFFTGSIDEVRYWNDARSETEIRQNMYREIPDPSDASLVAYYPCNSDLDDASSNSNNGTFNGGTASYTTSSAFFGPKKALLFSEDYVTLSSTFGLGSISVSGECWVNLPSTSEKGTFFKIGGGNGYGIGVGDGWFDAPGNELCMVYEGVRWIGSSTLIGTGWHHVAFTIGSSGEATIYLDGENVYDESGDPDDPVIPSGGYSYIGASSSTGRKLTNGTIDEVRLWSDIRTASELRENMNSTLNGTESNLVAYYNMDNGTGTKTTDIVGSSSTDGVITGASWTSSTAFNTWLNTSSTFWTTGSNWSDGAEPTSTDNVGIPDHDESQPELSSALSCNNLVVGSGATLTDAASVDHSAGKNVIVNGYIDVKAGNLLDVGKSLIITTTGELDVKPLGKVTVASNLKVNGSGTLTLNSSSSGDASLIVNGTATGDVIQERYIAATTWGEWDDGWHFLSSPVANYAIATNFTATDYDFYAWSEKYNIWVNYKDGTNPAFSDEDVNGSNNFELGRGYLAAYKLESTRNFTGTINVADVEIAGLTITGTTANNRSWHLLGNPFNSGLTWYTDWTTNGNIVTTAKIWSASGRSYSDIASGGVIPATNGFMVQASGGTGTLTIPEAKRTHGGTFYKSAEYPIIKLKAYNLDNPSFQESQLRFNPESTNEWDMEFDSDFLAGYAPYFYSVVEGVPQSVNSMPDLSQATTIPFTFIKNEGTNFSIEMYEVENMEMDVWLLDNKLNKDYNLSQSPTYYFTAVDSDNPDRFEIHFSPVGISQTEITHKPIQVYSHNSTITIINNNNLGGLVRITNILGQKMASFKLNSSSIQEYKLNALSGIYIVYTKTDNGNVYSEKIIIN